MKISTLGLTDLQRVTWLKSAETTNSVARIILKIAMKEDNLKFNDKNRVQYLNDWADVMTENSQGDGNDETYKGENIADHVADFLVWGNGLHIIAKSNMTEVGTEIKESIYKEMVDVIESSFETLKN